MVKLNYKKVNSLIQILIAILMTLQLLVYVVAEDEPFGGRAGGDAGASGKEAVNEQQITDQLKSAVDSDGTVDFENPLFKNNVETVKKVLREKYNLNINNFIGAKIENGNLIMPGGTSINLKTGKTVTMDAAGATINTFSEGNMVIINAVGVNYDGVNLKVARGGRVFYENTEATNVRNFVGEQSTLSLISADLIVAGSENLLSKVSNVIIQKSPVKSSFSFMCTGSDQQNLGSIKINCLPHKQVKADVTKSGTSITIDKDVTFEHNTIQGKADNDNAQFSYQDISPNNEQVITSLTTLKIQFNSIQQTIIAKTETKFKVDQSEGIYELSLGAESRFSHQEQEETKSYYLLNPSAAPYIVFLTTPSHQMSVESALALYNAFIDRAQNYFALNSIITFGIYKNALPHDIFESQQASNSVVLDNTKLALSNTDLACTSDFIIFSLHNADFSILEVCDGVLGMTDRYADFEYKDTPTAIENYVVSFNPAEISFTEGLLLQIDEESRVFRLYPKSLKSSFLKGLEAYEMSVSELNQCMPLEQPYSEEWGMTLAEWVKT